MKHINLDTAADDVKEFVSTLPLGDDGVELELDGQVICKVLPPQGFSEADQAVLIERVRQLVHQARQRNRGVPSKVIEREVGQAVDEVRRKTS